MKNLFVIRHAKSSWANSSQADYDRPLNDRGFRDAPLMAQRLYDKGFRIDAIVSSPALRALTTAQHFADKFGFAHKNITQIERMYHASSTTFYNVISTEFNDGWESVALFSHNPGITNFVNSLGMVQLDNMPTCAIFGVQADINHWSEFAESEKRFLLFDYPKAI